jgi:MFS family permease
MPLSRTSREYIAFMAIFNSGFFVFQSYYIIYLTENGLNYTDISLIFVGNFLALAVFNLFAGDFADRHGRKRAILIGGAINVVGFLVYGLSSSILLFLIAEIILAGSSALISGSVEAWFIDSLRSENRLSEAKKAFPTTSSVSNLLGILGGVVGSVLAAFALNLPMLAGALLVALATMFAFFLFKENFGEKSSRFAGLLKESISHFRRSPALRDLTYAEMFRSCALIVYFIIYQPYLVLVGMGKENLGIYFSLLMISTVAGNMLSTRVSGSLGRHRMLALAGIILFTSYMLQPLVHTYLLAGFLFAVCGFTSGLSMPAVIMWRNSLIPSRIRASTLAVLSSLLNLAAGAMTLVLGPVIDGFSMEAAMYIGAFLAAASVPLYLIANRRSTSSLNETTPGL